MREVDIVKLSLPVVDLWMNQWLLLTAGTPGEYNMMTVAWGSVGCMWGKPFVQVVARPQRHTRKYLEESDSFTLCAFSPEFRGDLQLLGTVSGRDRDKLAETRLTPRPSKSVAAPAYEEASLILECRKIYRQEFDPAGFTDPGIHQQYPQKDYHTAYFGEIVAAFAADDFGG